jgi:hypothetical protein
MWHLLGLLLKELVDALLCVARFSRGLFYPRRGIAPASNHAAK